MNNAPNGIQEISMDSQAPMSIVDSYNTKVNQNNQINNDPNINSYEIPNFRNKDLEFYSSKYFFSPGTSGVMYQMNRFTLELELKIAHSKTDFYFGHRASRLIDGSYFITGGEERLASLNKTFILDPLTGNTQLCSSMKYCRRDHSQIYNNGSIYVFGGTWNKAALNSAEKYIFGEDRWENLENIPENRVYSSIVNLDDNRILLVGGFTYDQYNRVRYILIINISRLLKHQIFLFTILSRIAILSLIYFYLFQLTDQLLL
jgi:hypothetical protein